MHYNFLFNGCSFTEGSELEGKNKDYEYRNQKRYSHIISEITGKTYDNIAIAGNSNDRIVRETINWFYRGNTCDTVIIQFTNILRTEFISKYEQHPTNFTPNFGVFTKWHTSHHQEHENAKAAYDCYYKHFYNNNIGLYNFYKNLFILEQYFEKNNMNYLFIKMDLNQFWITEIDQNKCKILDENLNQMDFYWQSGCKNRYSNITSIRNQLLDLKDKSNFTKNYSKEGYPYLTGVHPSELGHQKIADYIIKQLNK
jgi:hypothetical protein